MNYTSTPDSVVCETASGICLVGFTSGEDAGEELKVIRVNTANGSSSDVCAVPSSFPVDMISTPEGMPEGFFLLHKSDDKIGNRLSLTCYTIDGSKHWSVDLFNNGNDYARMLCTPFLLRPCVHAGPGSRQNVFKHKAEPSQQLMFYDEDGSVPDCMSRWETSDCSRIAYGNGRVAVHFNHANQFDNPKKPNGCDRHCAHSATTFDAKSGGDAKLAFTWEHGHSMRVQTLFTGTDFLTVNSTDQDPANIHAYRFMK